MKKALITVSLIILTVTIIFVSCKKSENDGLIISGDKVFAEEAKNWFTNSFVNTYEYKNGTANGNFKTPNWKYGKTYSIGNIKIAEFPLIAAKKKVYISEILTEAENRTVIANTKFKALFIKAPNKPMEVRIIQFTPTYNYLKSKNFDLSDLSFKDYTKDFKGDFMMFDFDNNFTKGYHFANEGIKGITLKTKFYDKTSGTQTSNYTASAAGDLCDNQTEIDPNCVYTVHTTYEVVCTNGWNVEEGFNPDYCHLEIVSIICELAYCNENNPALEACMLNGATEAQCACTLYGIGCENGGGGEECSGGGESCSSMTTKVTDALNNGTSGGGLNLVYEPANIINSTDRAGNVHYRTWKGVGWFNLFEVNAHFKRTYTLKPGRTAHTTNIANDYIWKNLEFDHFEENGAPFGYDVTLNYISHNPQGLNVDGPTCSFVLKYKITITYGCCGFTQNQYKTIEDAFFFDRRYQ